MIPTTKSSETKKLYALAAISALMSIFFSFMGAPFVRVLVTKKSKIFWFVGVVFIAALFFFKMHLIAIYVGAIWMTLGLYSELEKRGIDWKRSGMLSVISGILFGVGSYLAVTKLSLSQDLAHQIVEPLMLSLKQIVPDQKFETQAIMMYMPGVLGSALVSSIAASFVFESQIFQVFNLKREKLASGLKWLEFRLPDMFIWLSLFAFLFSMVDTSIRLFDINIVQVIAINISIISVVAYFFQGISVIEFATRIFRVGRISKFMLYFLLITWALPLVTLLGLADYWVDFRRLLRKRIKVN